MTPEEVFSNLEMSLAELVETLDTMAAPERTALIAQGLAVIGEGLAKMNARAPIDLAPLVAAIKSTKPPVVNVHVPAPVVNFTAPEQKGGKWKVQYPTVHGIQTMTIERTE